MSKRNIEFLTFSEIIEIHRNQIELYGGDPGIRDLPLLSSAIAMPESSFDGNYLHENIFEMAAAYSFHLSQNHPFLDGNKRVALVAALIFLEYNNIEIQDEKEILYKTIMDLAKGKLTKSELAKIYQKLAISH